VNHQAAFVGVSIKELTEISHSLRGDSKKVDDVANALGGVQGLVKNFLGAVRDIHQYYNAGDMEKAGEALKATVDDEVAVKSHGPAGQPDTISGQSSLSPLTLQDIPSHKLAEFIELKDLKQMEEHAEQLVGIITETLPHLSELSRPTTKKRATFSAQNPPDAQTFNHRQYMHHLEHQQTTNNKVNHIFSTLQKHPVLHHHTYVVMAKHQLRIEALGKEVCPKVCEPHEWKCNCENLFTCVGDLTEYDLAVLISGG
jgi:hypothetical protein